VQVATIDVMSVSGSGFPPRGELPTLTPPVTLFDLLEAQERLKSVMPVRAFQRRKSYVRRLAGLLLIRAGSGFMPPEVGARIEKASAALESMVSSALSGLAVPSTEIKREAIILLTTEGAADLPFPAFLVCELVLASMAPFGFEQATYTPDLRDFLDNEEARKAWSTLREAAFGLTDFMAEVEQPENEGIISAVGQLPAIAKKVKAITKAAKALREMVLKEIGAAPEGADPQENVPENGGTLLYMCKQFGAKDYHLHLLMRGTFDKNATAQQARTLASQAKKRLEKLVLKEL